MNRQLETLFFEHSPPQKLLTDNDMAFCSSEFRAFANDWGVNLRFRCAYVPSGNGLAERCHCSVKCIAARMHCLIQEAVYWHNVTPRDSVSPPTGPANKIYRYEVRVKGLMPRERLQVPDVAITRSGIACGSKWCGSRQRRIDVPQNSAKVRWLK